MSANRTSEPAVNAAAGPAFSDTNQGPADVIARMNNALLAKYNEIRFIYVDATLESNRKLYELASRVNDVKQGEMNVYGAGAMKLIAGAMGWKLSTTYNYAAIAETWPEPQYDELMERRDCYGKPLTKSHLIELARVSDVREREALVDEWSESGLTVKKLMEAIKRRHDEREDVVARTPATTSPLKTAIGSIEAQLNAQQINFDAWGPQLERCIESTLPEGDTETMSRVEELRSAVDSIHDKQVEVLETCLELLTPFVAEAEDIMFVTSEE